MINRFKPFSAPSKIYFVDPDTGFKYEAASLKELYAKIRGYRQQNNLEEIKYLDAVIEHYLCSKPENIGLCAPAQRPLKRSVFQYIKGGVVLLKNLLYSSFASQDVADERSFQCAHCKYNVFPDRGPFLVWADSIAVASIEHRRSKHHAELGNCAACTCPLRAKVFYDGKVKLKPDEKQKMQEVNCWQLHIQE